MKTQINKKYALLLMLAVLYFAPSLAEEKQDSKNKSKETFPVAMDPFYEMDNPSEPIVLEFYDSDDNLVYQATVSKNDSADAQLAKYLNESDYLTNYSKTSYYRLNK